MQDLKLFGHLKEQKEGISDIYNLWTRN